jgi:Phosphate-selective porin O and P
VYKAAIIHGSQTLHPLPRPARTLTAIALAALTVAAAAQTAAPAPPTAELAAQIKAQQALLDQQSRLLEQQRLELERQRAELDRQRKQLESILAPLEAQAQQQAAATPPMAATSGTAGSAGRGLKWAGYADMHYQRYDFYENAQDTEAEQRGRTDIQRFVLAPRYDFGNGWSFAGEIEFEHGGTGSTIEYEAEEGGEYEAEIEKGGEIVLEQLWLQYSHSPLLNVRFGELVVPVGMINTHHQPTEYFTVERSLAETSLLPSVWHETGIELHGSYGQARYQLQLVTALDSTGFSGYEFVRGGMQRKLETKNASAFAFVAHGEYAFAPGVMLGASFYTGDSAPNRPRQNLDVAAKVTLAEVHGRYEVGPLTVRGQVLQGRIQNAEAITTANLNTYNGGELGVSRTPVGSRADSYFIEAGYDLLSLFAHTGGARLDAFARYDDYDTHAATEGAITRVARYARKATTVGINFKPQPGIVLKGELSRRTHEGTVGNTQNYLGLAAGFEF